LFFLLHPFLASNTKEFRHASSGSAGAVLIFGGSPP
jgi:hypothetical protein